MSHDDAFISLLNIRDNYETVMSHVCIFTVTNKWLWWSMARQFEWDYRDWIHRDWRNLHELLHLEIVGLILAVLEFQNITCLHEFFLLNICICIVFWRCRFSFPLCCDFLTACHYFRYISIQLIWAMWPLELWKPVATPYWGGECTSWEEKRQMSFLERKSKRREGLH